jgi:hypothetical protein
MPNWNSNVVEVRGPRKIVKELVDHKFDFQKIHPCPADLNITAGREGADDSVEQKALVAKEQANLKKYGYKNWYDWCVDQWGTKWNAGGSDNEDMIVDYDEDVDDQGIALFTFQSAWAPPVGVFQKLKELHPDLYIQGRYYEPGVGFFGVWDDGDDRCYNFESIEKGSKDEFWSSEDGILLDENFDIVEDMIRNEEYEMDEGAKKVRDYVKGEAQNCEETV